MKHWIKSERGSATVFALALISIGFLASLLSLQLRADMLVLEKQRVKLLLNRAVHAASLDWSESALMDGKLEWNAERAEASFKHYLYDGLGLNVDGSLGPRSFLDRPVEILSLQFIDEGPFPRILQLYQPISADPGSDTQTMREILRGPSVVAIVRVEHASFGPLPPVPYLVSAVEEVRW